MIHLLQHIQLHKTVNLAKVVVNIHIGQNRDEGIITPWLLTELGG